MSEANRYVFEFMNFSYNSRFISVNTDMIPRQAFDAYRNILYVLFDPPKNYANAN